MIHDENFPRGQWRLGRIQQVIRGSDGHTRGVRVKTQTKTGRSTVLQYPVQLLYPLEINCQPRSDNRQDDAFTTTDSVMDRASDDAASQETRTLPDMIGHKASMCTFLQAWRKCMGQTMLWQILVPVKRRRVPLFMESLSGILPYPWMGEGETSGHAPFAKWHGTSVKQCSTVLLMRLKL